MHRPGQASRDSSLGYLEAELYALDLHSTLGPKHAVTVNDGGLLGSHKASGSASISSGEAAMSIGDATGQPHRGL